METVQSKMISPNSVNKNAYDSTPAFLAWCSAISCAHIVQGEKEVLRL